MNRIALAAGIAACSFIASGQVFAADMPLKAAPYGPYDWSGMYFGGHIGGGWATNEISDSGLGLATLLGGPAVQTTNSSGFLGGVQAGSNYQFGRLVLGWEGDWSWGHINGNSTSNIAPFAGLLGAPTFTHSIGVNTDWTATAATRIGIAHDRWLAYGKAGVAFAHNSITENFSASALGVTQTFSDSASETRIGWMTGFGLEYAIWRDVSVKIEYDFLDFGSKTTSTNGNLNFLGVGAPVPGFGGSSGIQNNQYISEVKAGVNWRFGPNFW